MYKQGGVAAIETAGKGGRRHQHLTLEQERAFLQPFLARAARGEMATVVQIQRAFEAQIGHEINKSTIYRLLDRQGWQQLGAQAGPAQANAGKLTPQAETDLQAQGQRKQREAQRIQEDLQADVDRERNDILSRSTQKMSEVVKKIAEEKGYDVVMDVSNTVFFKPALEITNDAIAAYDKAYPAK